MNRQEVINIIHSARTPQEITHAFAVFNEWMQDHPNDVSVRSNCEMLEMLADAHGMVNYDNLPIQYIDCRDLRLDDD